MSTKACGAFFDNGNKKFGKFMFISLLLFIVNIFSILLDRVLI